YHAVFVLLSRAANIELLHVPFTGGAPSLQALMANTVELAVLAPEEMAGLANAGKSARWRWRPLRAFRATPMCRHCATWALMW
ncbi:MAG: hypothetical protein ACK5V0_13575, partial [Alphaproteobacteria bacterium]